MLTLLRRFNVVLVSAIFLVEGGAQAQELSNVADQTLGHLSFPPAAEIILPDELVTPGGTLLLELVAADDLMEVKVTIEEEAPNFELVARQALTASESIGALQKDQRLSFNLPLPARLVRPDDRRLGQREESVSGLEPEPTILIVKVTGIRADNIHAFSSAVLTFEGGGSGSFRVRSLSAYLQERSDQPGTLYQLPEEEIVPDREEEMQFGVEPEVESRSSRYLDENGVIHEAEQPRRNEDGQGQNVTPITVQVSGHIYFVGWDGNSHPASYIEVAVWEDDGSTASASADNIVLTNANGYFSTTVVHDDGDNDLELYLGIRTANGWVRVGNGYLNDEDWCESGNNWCGLDSETNYIHWWGPTITGVTGGSLTMNYTIADSWRGHAQIYDYLQDSAALTNSAFSPGQVRAVGGLPFDGAASIGQYGYHLVFGNIHGFDRSEDVAYHEHGHFTMYRRNSYRNPNAGGQHYVCSLYHPGLAWSEGWATGFAQHVKPDGFYDAANFFGARAHVEDARLGVVGSCNYQINTQSQHNEMWVAAAVNDFYDFGEPAGGADDPADRIHSFFQATEVIRTTNIDSINEFYNALRSAGYLTQLEKHYASRAMNANHFPVSVIPPPSPLSVAISGPSSCQTGQTCTWTANVSGGSGSISYLWDWRRSCLEMTDAEESSTSEFDPKPNDVPICEWYGNGTNQSYSLSRPQTGGIQVRVRVTRGSETASRIKYVSIVNGVAASAEDSTEGVEAGLVGSLSSAPPEELTLENARPNPFVSEAQIVVGLPEAMHVRLAVYDLLGREVAVLADGDIEAGWHPIPFNAHALSTGLYICRLETAREVLSTRITKIE